MMGVYADSADFVNWLGMWWIGRAEIEKQHALIHESRMRESRLTIVDQRIRFLRPDVAVARIKWSLVGAKDFEGKPRGPRSGLLIDVLTRENGRWVVQATQNTDIIAVPATRPGK